MKNTIWKSTFREIKQSFGRFAAILAIVAMGVAFYAGLTVTESAMVKTTGEYLEKQEFYDYRLLSTLGFEQQEVDFLKEKEDVQYVEGAVSFDIIYQDDTGNESVLKTHSITEEINRTVLLSGRMPESADECVVDYDLFTESDLGKTIRLSENNAEEDLENFKYREYTIVGIVQSPYYIQYERGNTSLGSGKISGFVYIPYEGYDVDYFTEIFVNFTESFPLYSDEYKDFIDEKEVAWEEYSEEAAQMRYQRIVDEANEELAEAKAEFETEKADAEADLKDAEEQLADAEAQLADGETQLADAKAELEDAKNTLAEKEKELADAEQEIADGEQELIDGERELQEGMDKWQKNSDKVDASEVDLLAARDQLNIEKQALAIQESELLAAEAALLETEAALNLQKQQMEAQKADLDNQEQLLIANYGEGNVPPEMLAPIQEGKAQIEAGLLEVDAGLAQIATQKGEIETGKTAIETGKTEMAAYEQQINSGLAEINTANKKLADALKEIRANEQKLADARTELEDAKVQLEDGKLQLADAKADLVEGEQTLLEKEQELADAKLEYEDGLKEYEDGLAEFNDRIADAEQKIADAEQDIADLEEPDSYLLGRDTNVGYVCFDNDSSIIAGIAKVFPLFFFAVAALVCITTMNRMVEEQRTQIGVLKALGYSESTIMNKYMFYSGSAAIVGCIIGYAGGTYIFPRVIWYAYGTMYSVDSLLYVFDLKLAIISLVVSVLCSMGATWFSCRVELNQVAAQLMRPKTPRAGKRVFLEHIPFIWNRLGFLKKVSIRNIFRYKKRLIMMVLGISGCTALLVTGYGVKDSIANVAGQQFGEIQIFDINMTFADEYTDADGKEIESVAGVTAENYVPVHESGYDLVTDRGRKSVNLVVFDSEADMTPYLSLHTEDKEQIAFPAEGYAVITDRIAEDYDIQVGDTVMLQNEDLQTITVTISGINQNFLYNYIYLNDDTYEQQVGHEVEYKSVYLNVPEDFDAHQVAAALMNGDNVSNVTVNSDTADRLSSMLKSMDLIVVVIIICAGGLAFIVLYNLTNINITERIREIATIKVLGFNKKEIAAYVFRENLVLSGMGIAVGLVLGYYLHLFVMNQVRIDMVSFDIHVRPVSYLYSVLLTFAFAWMVNQFMRGKLERVSMTESLKSVD